MDWYNNGKIRKKYRHICTATPANHPIGVQTCMVSWWGGKSSLLAG